MDDLYYDGDLTDEELLQAYYNGELDPDIAEELMKYYDQEPYEQERLPLWDLMERCVIPTWTQTAHSIIPLLAMCFIYRMMSYFLAVTSETNEDEDDRASVVSKSVLHITCAILGLSALHLFFDFSLLFLVVYDALSFTVLILTCWKFRGYSGFFLSILTVIYLLLCELVFADPVQWHKIRGSQMILSMKVISLAFDLDNNIVVKTPNIWDFIGYSFHVGSVIFGPWVSYSDYQKAMSQQKLTMAWIRKIFFSATMALICVVVSNCLIPWLILNGTSDWLEAYRDAQSFRFSHYFVSFMSEVTVVVSGIGLSMNSGEESWDISVARPWNIELPRSLVEVVTNWNLPMHTWLRSYVFKTVKPAGNFAAVLFTYAASSLLHGLNFQLASVLLSLGFYTYVEFVFRNKLSKIFDACIQGRTCKPDCGHSYNRFHPNVIITNMAFSALAVFHLAYLGLMFDSSSEEDSGYTMWHTLGKWANLNYMSHWVALGTFIFHLLI